jgi:error-prone DNA polymerase
MDALVSARRARPFESLEDFWRRAGVSRPVLENLVAVGALDGVAGGRSRRELLWRAVALGGGHAPNGSGPNAGGPAQLALGLDEHTPQALPELPDYTALEETQAELAITGIDARRHLMDLYRPLLAELGCTDAAGLARARNDSEVWVAGVKVATQTPAIRSGQRIIFVTLDDLAGPVDATVFERVQAHTAHTVFHSWLLLFRGAVRKRGGASRVHPTDPRNVGVTVVVEEAFDLARLAADRDGGVPLADALERQRRVRVQETATPAPRAGLWHASGGSAGGS